MNKKQILLAQIIAIIGCLILGTLLHFTYEWSGENKVVAVFSSVNESTWEHLKLSFYPMLLATIVEGFFIYRKSNNYLEAKIIGIFTAISFTTIFFYTYTGIIGTNFTIINIGIFIVSIILGESVAYKIMIKPQESIRSSRILAICISMYLLLGFILFTYNPPKINYFKDPITGEYGINL